MITVEMVQELERMGAWADLIAAAPEIVSHLSGEHLARAHGALATAHFTTAVDRMGMKTALRHAHEAYRLANFGTPVWFWALQKVTSINVDIGDYRSAERFGRIFVKANGAPPLYLAFVLRDLHHVYYRRGLYRGALALATRSMRIFQALGNGAQVYRTQINIAWIQIKMGNHGRARRVLPPVPASSDLYVWHGAMAQVAYHEGDHRTAEKLARAALEVGRNLWDNLDAAEAALLLRRVAIAKRDLDQAQQCNRLALYHAIQQVDDAWGVLLIELTQRGGELLYESAPPSCGPRGTRRTGLLGVVG